jgi:benzil reductase ((S)-benzoin forming)
LEQEIENIIPKITSGGTIVFINNASIITPIQTSHTLSSNDHLDNYKVNCLAPTIITSLLLRRFDPSSLVFVNITSGAANRPIWGWDLYCSTKSYTKMHFDVLAIENKSLKVIQFDPGVLDTNMQKSIRDASDRIKELSSFKEMHETGKLKSPDEAAQELLALLKS